jgi:glycosylphosphatidylinositol transamidase (GPIT) subunit GPI8
MKIVDELFEMYRNKLTGDEEDIDMLAFAFLEEMSQEDLLHLIQEMDKQELYNLMGLYLIESLKGKFAQEEYGQQRTNTYYPRNIH